MVRVSIFEFGDETDGLFEVGLDRRDRYLRDFA
jgi:hypothetical protein